MAKPTGGGNKGGNNGGSNKGGNNGGSNKGGNNGSNNKGGNNGGSNKGGNNGGSNKGGNNGGSNKGGNNGGSNKGGNNGGSNKGGNNGGSNKGGNATTVKTNDTLLHDLSVAQKLGATNASDTYRKAVAAGYSTAEAAKLAGTMGRMAAAAKETNSSKLYQYGATQSDVNLYNISVAKTLSTNTLSTGTYSFNTNTYSNVQSELKSSADVSKVIQENIQRSLANTEKGSAQYTQLEKMNERMSSVEKATTFVSSKLADAYNATKSADETVKKIVMSVKTDSLKITVGDKIGYDSNAQYAIARGDSKQWSSFVNSGIVGKSTTVNTTTTKNLQEVHTVQGMNTMSAIFTAYDAKNNIDSCTTMADYKKYAQNTDNGLEEVARRLKDQGYTEEQWRKFLDNYFVNRSGVSSRNAQYENFVDYFNNYKTKGDISITYTDSNGELQSYDINYDNLEFIPFSTTYPLLKDADKQKALFAVGANLPENIKEYFTKKGYQLDGFGLMGIMIGESTGGKTSFIFGTDGGTNGESHVSASETSKDIVAQSLVNSGLCSNIAEAKDKVNSENFYYQLAEAVTCATNITNDGNDIRSGGWGVITEGMKADTNRWRSNYINGTYDKNSGGTGANGERYVYSGW